MATHGKDAKETGSILKAFLVYLRRDKGMKKLPAIVRALGRLEAERRGITRVIAVVAREWKGGKRSIERAAEDIFGIEKADVNVEVRRDILGGISLKTDDAVWDATSKTRLGRLKRRLVNGR